MGVEGAGHGADSAAHISKLIWDLQKKVEHKKASVRFYKSVWFFWSTYISSYVRMPTLSVDSMYSFMNETHGLYFLRFYLEMRVISQYIFTPKIEDHRNIHRVLCIILRD